MRQLSLIIACLALFGCSSTLQHVEYAKVPEIPADAHPTPIHFKGVELILPPGTEIGIQSAGKTCGLIHQTVSRKAIKNKIEQQFIRESFQDALQSNGYKVVGSLDRTFDEEDELQRAEYSMRGKIKAVQLDICKHQSTIFGYGVNDGVSGELYLSVDWTVYDQLKRTVVYKTRTEGYTQRSEPNQEGLTLLLHDAFEMAAHNLAAKPSFYNLIVLGKRPTKGEAGYPRPSNQNDVGEERPRKYEAQEPLFIKRLPLFRKPFRDHSAQILSAQVLVQKNGQSAGVFMTRKGHILTNARVVGDALRTRILTQSGQSLVAEVLRVDKARDVALLRLEERPAIGEDVYAVGHSGHDKSGLRSAATKGIISAYRTHTNPHSTAANILLTDIAIPSGIAGAALVDAQGNLLGLSTIHSANALAGGGLPRFIPIADALSALSITHSQ